MKSILNSAINYALNYKGFKTNEKIIVIQSDDWGSIRMPSNRTRIKLQEYTDIMANGAYAKYDTLASRADLEALFDVLSSVKDKNNNSAILSANCLMANPDFESISKNNFESYQYEHIETTFKRYNNSDALNLWHEGISNKIFLPQFHGREHVNFNFWLDSLRSNHISVRKAFDHKTFGVSFKNLNYNQTNFQRAWDTSLTSNEDSLNNSLIDGLNLFENFFGYKSLSVVAPNYTWSQKQEAMLRSEGVLAIQGILKQRLSQGFKAPYAYKKRFTELSKSQNILDYQRRNVFFEPSNRIREGIVENAMNRINISFKMKKPAIIGTHRVNFVGGLEQDNRDKNLKLFRKLLAGIINKWPDVIFMSAADLALKMSNQK